MASTEVVSTSTPSSSLASSSEACSSSLHQESTAAPGSSLFLTESIQQGLRSEEEEETVADELLYGEEEEEEGTEKDKKSIGKKSSSKAHKIRMPQRKGGMQLWQFLYALLEDPEKRYRELIEWTDNRPELEFRLLDPEAIAMWWGNIKHRANMTYERLSRSLRYYYDRGILKKMGGERYLYRFCVDPEKMYKHIGNSDSRPVLKPMPIQVSKWMYSRMVLPTPHGANAGHAGIFFSGIAPPEYSAAVLQQQHQQTALPPPPPYPGYTGGGSEHQYYLHSSRSSITGYEYLAQHCIEAATVTGGGEGMTSYLRQYEPHQLHHIPDMYGASSSSMACYNPGYNSFYPLTSSTTQAPVSNSPLMASAVPTTAGPMGYHSHLLPHQSSLHQLHASQYEVNPESSSPLAGSGPFMDGIGGGEANSPDYSSSTCSGGDCEMALDEILPILASMEQQSDELSLLSSPHNSYSDSPSPVQGYQTSPGLYNQFSSGHFSSSSSLHLSSPHPASIYSPLDQGKEGQWTPTKEKEAWKAN